MKKIITLIILLFIVSCGNISDKEYLKKLIEYRKQLAAREITQEEYTVLKNKMINKMDKRSKVYKLAKKGEIRLQLALALQQYSLEELKKKNPKISFKDVSKKRLEYMEELDPEKTIWSQQEWDEMRTKNTLSGVEYKNDAAEYE
jgi:hypothetical protein